MSELINISCILTVYKSTRGHSLKLFYPDSRINVRANFFSVRVISLWNRLPADLVQDNNLIKFKSMLYTVNFSVLLCLVKYMFSYCVPIPCNRVCRTVILLYWPHVSGFTL